MSPFGINDPQNVLGKLPLGDQPTSELSPQDPLDRARSLWKKGRFEFMGGPVTFTQDGKDNNNRTCGYPPAARYQDPMVEALGVDSQE